MFRWFLQEKLNEVALEGDKNTVSLSTITSIPKGDVLIPEGVEIKGIRFRDKCTGWKKYSFALHLAKATADGEKIQFTLSKDLSLNPYLNGFINDLYLRPSCYNCHSKSLSSNSDFTVADFWGQDTTFPEYDNNTGVSAVLLNTAKAKELVESIHDINMTEKEFGTFFQYNPSLNHCVKRKRSSAKFWKLYGRYPFAETVRRSYKNNIIDIIIKIKQRLLK